MKRYSLDIQISGDPPEEISPTVDEDVKGDWVSYDEAQADIDEKELLISNIEYELNIATSLNIEKDTQIDKLLDWSYKALKHLPQSYHDSLLEITDEHRGK